MKNQAQSLKRVVISGVLASLAAFGLAACDQEPGKSPMKPSQGFGATPDAGKGATPGSATGVAAGEPGRPTEAAPANDGTLAAKVKSAISAEPTLSSMALDVSARDGVVTLHGTAETDAERNRAAQLALNVDGVRSVKNELVIVRGS